MISLRKEQFIRWLEKHISTTYPSKLICTEHSLTCTACISGIEYKYQMLLSTGVIVETVTSYRTFSGYPTDVLGYSVHIPIAAKKPPVLEDSELTKRIMQSDSSVVTAKQTSDGSLLETYRFCRFINKEQMPYYAIKESVLREGNRNKKLPLEVYQLQP